MIYVQLLRELFKKNKTNINQTIQTHFMIYSKYDYLLNNSIFIEYIPYKIKIKMFFNCQKMFRSKGYLLVRTN